MKTTEKIKILWNALISVPGIIINRIKFEIIRKEIQKLTGIEPKINEYGYFDDYLFFYEFRRKFKVEGVVTPKEVIINKFGKKYYEKIENIHCRRISLNYLKLLFKK